MKECRHVMRKRNLLPCNANIATCQFDAVWHGSILEQSIKRTCRAIRSFNLNWDYAIFSLDNELDLNGIVAIITTPYMS